MTAEWFALDLALRIDKILPDKLSSWTHQWLLTLDLQLLEAQVFYSQCAKILYAIWKHIKNAYLKG